MAVILSKLITVSVPVFGCHFVHANYSFCFSVWLYYAHASGSISVQDNYGFCTSVWLYFCPG
jgi:hypothetical protein